MDFGKLELIFMAVLTTIVLLIGIILCIQGIVIAPLLRDKIFYGVTIFGLVILIIGIWWMALSS